MAGLSPTTPGNGASSASFTECEKPMVGRILEDVLRAAFRANNRGSGRGDEPVHTRQCSILAALDANSTPMAVVFANISCRCCPGFGLAGLCNKNPAPGQRRGTRIGQHLA